MGPQPQVWYRGSLVKRESCIEGCYCIILKLLSTVPVKQCEELIIVQEEVEIYEHFLYLVDGEYPLFVGVVFTESLAEIIIVVSNLVSVKDLKSVNQFTL